MRTRIDDVLRRSACRLPMTVDREPTPGADPDSRFHRGVGTSALWAHYADNHRGVCLLLDAAAVYEDLREHVAMKDSQYSYRSQIKYVDVQRRSRNHFGVARRNASHSQTGWSRWPALFDQHTQERQGSNCCGVRHISAKRSQLTLIHLLALTLHRFCSRRFAAAATCPTR